MADDRSKKGPEDRSKISTSEDWEVRYWCDVLDVTKEELVSAVRAVGNGVDDVKRYFSRPEYQAA